MDLDGESQHWLESLALLLVLVRGSESVIFFESDGVLQFAREHFSQLDSTKIVPDESKVSDWRRRAQYGRL